MKVQIIENNTDSIKISLVGDGKDFQGYTGTYSFDKIKINNVLFVDCSKIEGINDLLRSIMTKPMDTLKLGVLL